jgi:hypothetical protein
MRLERVPADIADSHLTEAINLTQDAVEAVAGRSVYRVDQYGADPTGVKSSDDAVAAALRDMGSEPGVLLFGVGDYRLSITIRLVGTQALVGQGVELTTIHFEGTGDCVRLNDPVTVFPPSKSGLIDALKISGLKAGAGSAGIHAGDLYNMRIPSVWICDFVASGSVGMRLENTIQLSERADVYATIDNCDTAVVFEHSDSGDPSFSYSDWNFTIKSFANQNGVVIRNGIMTHSRLRVRGNFFNCTAGAEGFGSREGSVQPSPTNTGVAFIVGATDADVARIERCEVFIGVENGGLEGATPGHTTLNLGANSFIWASGTMNFFRVTGFPDWVAGSQRGWFSFAGFKNIDSTFGTMVSPQTFSVGGSVSGGAGRVDSDGTVHLESGNAFITRLNSGNNTLSFTDGGGRDGYAAYELLLIQPGSGQPGTVTLPGNAYVVPGGSLSLTTTPNEVNVLKVYTFDHNSFYVIQLA